MKTKPTYENQLQHARKLLEEKGIEALRNPHALTGKICGCGSCFCCAALQVLTEAEKETGVYGETEPKPYQPKTGQACSCRTGRERDNCPQCEGTGQRIDFKAIRERQSYDPA